MSRQTPSWNKTGVHEREPAIKGTAFDPKIGQIEEQHVKRVACEHARCAARKKFEKLWIQFVRRVISIKTDCGRAACSVWFALFDEFLSFFIACVSTIVWTLMVHSHRILASYTLIYSHMSTCCNPLADSSDQSSSSQRDISTLMNNSPVFFVNFRRWFVHYRSPLRCRLIIKSSSLFST